MEHKLCTARQRKITMMDLTTSVSSISNKEDRERDAGWGGGGGG